MRASVQSRITVWRECRIGSGASLEDDEFVKVVAQNLPMPGDDRQDLLERSSVLARARALIEGRDR